VSAISSETAQRMTAKFGMQMHAFHVQDHCGVLCR